MGLKCGFVGLPNVGKSTLFNALTKSNIAAENYPFCTIEPNTGVVELPDNRLRKISDLLNPKKTISAIVEFTDIAGLVAGASQGEGLGNKFLANIRESSAIINVVRCFEDENVTHVNGRVDPLSDIETITTELALSDLNTLEKRSVKLEKLQKSGDKKVRFEYELVNKCLGPLNNFGSLNIGDSIYMIGKKGSHLSCSTLEEVYNGESSIDPPEIDLYQEKLTFFLLEEELVQKQKKKQKV